MIQKTPPEIGGVSIQIGGAAGYCPPVQKVTDYPSTGIVYLNGLRLIRLKNRHKHLIRRVESCPDKTPQPILSVSDIYITLLLIYVACKK